MTTRNIVPRANNEGELGTSGKKWKGVSSTTGSFTVVDVDTNITARPQTGAPTNPVNGMIAYADGTNWNPGSGVGFYGYVTGSWYKFHV